METKENEMTEEVVFTTDGAPHKVITEPELVEMDVFPDDKTITLKNFVTVQAFLDHCFDLHDGGQTFKGGIPYRAHGPVHFRMINGWTITNPDMISLDICILHQGIDNNEKKKFAKVVTLGTFEEDPDTQTFTFDTLLPTDVIESLTEELIDRQNELFEQIPYKSSGELTYEYQRDMSCVGGPISKNKNNDWLGKYRGA